MKRLHYGSREVSYTVERRERTTLEISVYPDCEVEVIAPMAATDDAIEQRVRKRLRWITRQQRAFENFFPSHRHGNMCRANLGSIKGGSIA